tara:strand:+ start:1605 stop:1844 length:240 start_codon:yes stop_codon:yes gene_type:complete
MPTLYKVPLQIDPDTTTPFTMVEALDRHPSLIIEYPEDITICYVTGTQEDLASFFKHLDGPGQSFPIDEFIEFIQDYKV